MVMTFIPLLSETFRVGLLHTAAKYKSRHGKDIGQSDSSFI